MLLHFSSNLYNTTQFFLYFSLYTVKKYLKFYFLDIGQMLENFDYYRIFMAVLNVAAFVTVFVASFFLSGTLVKKYYLMNREWR
jgi:hypothetical protein